MSLSKRPNKSVSAARGAVLAVSMRWTDRLIGLTSTLILARLLVPGDFGIVAMATVVVGLIDTLLDLGVGSALIQNKHAERADFDTAWTLRLCQAGAAACILALAAPLAGDYFRDPRVVNVIRLMAVSMLVGGLENIGIVTFQKNMEFGQDFRYFFFRRLGSFVVTIILAFTLRSYWAMVIGGLFGRVTGVILSYAMHEFRPRISFARIRQLWGFSQWILVRNLGVYGQSQLDKFIVGRRADAASLGAYSLADDIASMPTTELLAPLGRVLFPVFVKVADDAERLREVFGKAIGIQTLFALPAGVGLALIANDAVPVLLGDRWMAVIPFLRVLALMSIFAALSHSSAYLLLSVGRVRLQAWLAWTQLGLLAVLVMVVFPNADALGVAYARLSTSAAGLLIIIVLVMAAVKTIRLTDFVRYTWRALAATAVMSAGLLALGRSVDMGHVARLVLLVFSGAGMYGFTIVMLWRISGCPDGAELYLLEQVHLKEKFFRWMRVSRHEIKDK